MDDEARRRGDGVPFGARGEILANECDECLRGDRVTKILCAEQLNYVENVHRVRVITSCALYFSPPLHCFGGVLSKGCGTMEALADFRLYFFYLLCFLVVCTRIMYLFY